MKRHTQAAKTHIFNTNIRKLLQAKSQAQDKAQPKAKADRQGQVLSSTLAIAFSSFVAFATAFH